MVGRKQKVKVIIAGSRTITDYGTVVGAVEDSGFEITEVVSGTAKGVDQLGERYAMDECIPIKKFKPQWAKYKKTAGFIRNEKMVNYVAPNGGLILVWDGQSSGSAHTLKYAKQKGIKIYLHIPGGRHVHIN